jgi:NADH-quinone oxidoreductase subunit M
VAAVGMIIAAMYLLYMVGRIVWGPLKEPRDHHRGHGEHAGHLPADLTWREIGVLTPLAVLCLYIGIKPIIFTDTLAAPIENALADANYAVRMHDMGYTAAGPATDDLSQHNAIHASLAGTVPESAP